MAGLNLTTTDPTVLADLTSAACWRGGWQAQVPDPAWQIRIPDPAWTPTIPDPAWTATIPVLDKNGKAEVDPNTKQPIMQPNPVPQPQIPNPTPRVTVLNPIQPRPMIPNPVTAEQFRNTYVIGLLKSLTLDWRAAQAASVITAAKAAAEAKWNAAGIALTVTP